jgi:hypothetical protein
VQLTELLFQKVFELGAQGTVPLRPGYVGLVSKARTLRPLLLAALFPGPEDQRLLSDGSGPARVGVGLLAPDGSAYRLLRELGGSRQLHRFDAGLKKFAPLTEDEQEIGSFLQGASQLPAPDSYGRFFVLGARDLPSRRTAPSSALLSAVGNGDPERVQALRTELQQTRSYEEVQDRLFRVSQRLIELGTFLKGLSSAVEEVARLEEAAGRSPFTPEQVKDLTARAQRADADQRSHAEQLGDFAQSKRQLQSEEPGEPAPLARDPLLWGGLAAGVAIDVVAFLLRNPSIAFLALLPYVAPLVAALRWIGAHEELAKHKDATQRLKLEEAQAKKSFAEQQQPLRAALRAARADGPRELLELFKSRADTLRLLALAREKLEKLRADPLGADAERERAELQEEKVGLEATVAAQGFARPIAEVERDLRRELGQEPDPARKVTAPSAGDDLDARVFSERAAELAGCGGPELWQQLGARFPTYLSALTDQRIVSGGFDGQQLVLAASDGRTGPYATLPQPMRDQVWIALRLVLLERVALTRKLPIFVDDTFSALDPVKRLLVHKMLKGIAAQTQVIHRLTEPPAQGLFDHVAQLP